MVALSVFLKYVDSYRNSIRRLLSPDWRDLDKATLFEVFKRLIQE